MKTIAAASFYFESQTENAYAAAYNSDRRPGALIGIFYEGAGYATINFTTVPLSDVKGSFSAK